MVTPARKRHCTTLTGARQRAFSMSAATVEAIRDHTTPGDPLETARLAGSSRPNASAELIPFVPSVAADARRCARELQEAGVDLEAEVSTRATDRS